MGDNKMKKEERYNKDQFVKMLEDPKLTREQLSLDRVLMNIEPFTEACMSLFAKPGSIRQKIERMRGWYGSSWVTCEDETKIDKIEAQILEKTIGYRKQVLEGITNMEVSGFDYYRSRGWDHEGENIVHLIFHSKLNEDAEVIRELWKKIKQSPNGFLKDDEFGPFMKYALRDIETYQRIVSFGLIRTELTNGQSIIQAAYPLITNLKQYKEHHKLYYEGHKDAPRVIESDAESLFIIETLDKTIKNR